ncbi:MAG: CHASE domain-containing protein [Verrucomicrobia bacterium]|nr:CHASE domain-containing protein [Verrucomicrobiota bacterium]
MSPGLDRARLGSYLPVGLVVVLGLALTLNGFSLLRRKEQQQVQARFEGLVENHLRMVQRQRDEVEFLFLALRTLFQFSASVPRDKFHGATTELMAAIPSGIESVEWAPRVTARDRPLVEAEARRNGLASFQFTQRDSSGRLVPAARRNEYVPICFLEPARANAARLGYDLASDPELLDQLVQARDSGQLVVSPRVGPSPTRPGQPQTLVITPVYQPGARLDTLPARRTNLQGFIIGRLNLQLASTLTFRHVSTGGLDVLLTDDSASGTNRILAFYPAPMRARKIAPPSEARVRAGPHLEAIIHIGGREWSILFRPAPEWVAANTSAYPYGVLVAGLGLTGLVAAYLLAIARRTRVIEEQVAIRTAALRSSNEQLAQEIAERKRAEEERHHLEQKMQEAQKLESLGVLAGGIAHDFNNILAGVLGNAGLVRLDLPCDSAALPFVREIEAGATRAADLCAQMLAYAGRGHLQVSRLDLSRLVAETVHLLEVSISKRVRLQFEMAPNLPAVLGDPTQLRQVVMNLVMNASEAIGNRPGQITVGTAVRFADRLQLRQSTPLPDLPEDNYVCLTVADDGCGMDAATQVRIFDPFFSTKFLGRGLGLAAVQGIVRGHHGTLKVDSAVGQGSTFTLFLPVAGDPISEPTPTPASAAAGHGVGTALVVDDEETVRTVAARMLENFGYHTILAPDGREALARIESATQPIRFVLLDLTMPRLDGEQTFRALRRLRPDLPILVMSGYSEEELAGRFAGPGPTGFLAKPFKPETLASKLQTLLATAR